MACLDQCSDPEVSELQSRRTSLMSPEATTMIPNAQRMFNFDLGETADAIRETVQDFAGNEIAPRAAEIDRSNQFPRDLWPKLGALGLHGITVEEEYGGAISSTASRWKRFHALLRQSGCPMARIPISASTSFAATATRRKSANICRS
jgi:alkylation response protein AidB-like acyl-CoA dehydrogenase